jgi:hypothetical protein
VAQQRFSLQWDRPAVPGASTHVSLYDGGRDALHVVASGHGAGEADALADLLSTLRERRESPDAIAYAAEQQAALTGTRERSQA